MSYTKPPLRDIGIALIAGAVAEAILVVAGFELGSDLADRHPWLAISQMPGLQISEQLFSHPGSHASLFQAMTSGFLIQGTVLSVVALGVIYAYRIICARRT